MFGTQRNEAQALENARYDRDSEIRAFDDTKAGVKGLVDAGFTEIPSIFVDHNDKPDMEPSNGNSKLSIPTIDIEGVDDAARRTEIVSQVKEACEEWGFFQIVNHGFPVTVMNEMIEGVRRFNEQDLEVRQQYYRRDRSCKIRYNSNHNLFVESAAAAWRDTIMCIMAPNPPDPQEIPEVLRGILFEFTKHVTKVCHTLYDLLSEALGLNPSYLRDIGCAETLQIAAHYHPPCPQPELTFGNRSHVDMGLLTILLQDHVGGFQVLHKNQWVDVPPLLAGLVINVGEFMQLITNDKFKAVQHRALVSKESTRISVAVFAKPHYPIDAGSLRVYGPIKEMITEEEPPLYQETTYKDYEIFFLSKSGDLNPKLPYYKLSG